MPENNDKSWWDWIVNIAETLADIYKELVEAGIITTGEAESMEGQGLTREEIAAIVDARLAAARWQTYLPWIIAGGLGIGLVLVLALRK